jgi:phosphoglycerate dehydrogenase-like enzyme
MKKLKGLYILNPDSFDLVYGPREKAEIARLVDIYAPLQSPSSIRHNPSVMSDAEVVFSGWGGPTLDARFLEISPRLKAMFYGAGSMASILTQAVWDRGIIVTSAIAANGTPVAEYTLATILFSLKHGWRLARELREPRPLPNRDLAPGCYGSTIGLISLGAIARNLLRLLRPFDMRIIVWDPFLMPEEAEELDVETVTLDELFAQADVVSLHAPLLPETEGMIGGDYLRSMKSGATFINTARGRIVRQDEMIDVARSRPDLQFVLDVAEPDPLPHDNALLKLPNVIVTPHIAGSVGNECRRMGRYMVEELERFVAGKPLRWAVTRESAWHSSHRPITEYRPTAAEPNVVVHLNPAMTRKPARVQQV